MSKLFCAHVYAYDYIGPSGTFCCILGVFKLSSLVKLDFCHFIITELMTHKTHQMALWFCSGL